MVVTHGANSGCRFAIEFAQSFRQARLHGKRFARPRAARRLAGARHAILPARRRDVAKRISWHRYEIASSAHHARRNRYLDDSRYPQFRRERWSQRRDKNKNADSGGGFEALYDDAVGDVLHGAGKESFEAIKIFKGLSSRAYVPARNAKYPNGFYGESLKQIAQLIKADIGVEVAFAKSGGWDTHVNQGGAQGLLSRRLKEFGDGLAALYNTWATA